MNTRFPARVAALLLAASFLCVPAASSGTDIGIAAADNAAPATDNAAPSREDGEFREPDFGEGPAAPPRVADPIEPVNRAIFAFNDKAYHWVFHPVAKGYGRVVPERVRVSVRNFFSNLSTPGRVVNHLLQGDLRDTGTELVRLVVNSTIGILGLFDPANDGFGIGRREADLGQTLGMYGLGQGMYLVLPVLGPSTLRDGVGRAGDSFLDPVSHVDPPEASIGVKAYREVNHLSLRLGAYDELVGSAVDPYVALRDAYLQNRANAVRSAGRGDR